MGYTLTGLLCIGIVWTFGKVDARIRPAADLCCTQACRMLLSEAVAQGVADTLLASDGMELTLSNKSYNENGEVTGISANPHAMNTVQAMLIENVNASLRERESESFTVELGTLTGLTLLSGRGADIPLRFSPKGSAQVRLASSLTSGGVNQTVYRVEAVITVQAVCTVPLYAGEASMEFSYLLEETLIVGDVPMLNLDGEE